MRPSLTCSLSCRRRWPLSALAASLLAGLGLDAWAAEPVPPSTTPERASAWLLRQPAERYDGGAAWLVPAEKPAQQALRNQVVDGLRALPLDHPNGLPRLADWLAGLPVTGRAALASADARWLEVHPDQDPVLLQGGDSLELPERPRTVTVVLENGERCRVPAQAGGMAFDYVRACVADAADRDVVWIAQPDGRTYRYGTGLWNGEAQDPPAAGAWIWAPARQSRIPASLSDALIRLLATQGAAPDTQGYSVPPVANSLPDGGGVRQRALPLTASDWGEIGLLQTPTARMEAAGDTRLSISRTTPYTRATVMFQPLDWIEFGFRYVTVSNQDYGIAISSQSFKDKNFDVKLRLREESRYLPGIAVGARDIGGTGLFSGEYVVASKRTGNFDWSLGLGWGYLGARGNLKNPLSVVSDRFSTRPAGSTASGGTLESTSYFRGPTSLFGGVQWQSPYQPLVVKLEYDGNNYQREPFSATFRQRVPINVGVVYRYSPHIDISAGVERGDKVSFGITFHGGLNRLQSPKLFDTPAPAVQAARPAAQASWNDLSSQMNRDTGWRVTEAVREGDTLRVSVSGATGLYRSGHFDRLVAYLHRDSAADVNRFVIDFVEHGMVMGSKTIDRADWVALHTEAQSPAQRQALGGDVPTAPLADITPPAQPQQRQASAAPAAPAPAGARTDAGFWRSADGRFTGGLGPSFWQTLGGPDSFVLYQIGIKGDAEYRLTRSTWVNASANLRVIDNYDKFKYTAPSNLPRVRTLAREFVTTSRFTLSNLQITHAEQLGGNHFASIYGGLLEPMYGGVGAEYLYRPLRSRWAFGVDVNRVRQRAFEQNFSFRDYQVTTGHASIYWDTGWNGVNVRLSAGQYLAGDKGATLDVSRRFANGVVIGAYATKTNVSAAQFGEGSFDKGLYVSFPFDAILPRSTPTTGTIFWTPLTRDGGARLARTQTLYSVTSARALDAFSAGPPPEDRLRSGDDVFTPRKD